MSIINENTKSIDLTKDDPIRGIRSFGANLFFIILLYAILSFLGITKHNIFIYCFSISCLILTFILVILTQILLTYIYQQSKIILDTLDKNRDILHDNY